MYRVLLVEDNVDTIREYQSMKIWQECGFEIVRILHSSAEAWSAVQKEHYDLVVSSLKLPTIDAFAFLRNMREADIKICTVIVSAHEDYETIRKCFILGAMDYLIKPPEEKHLKNILLRAETTFSQELAETLYQSAVDSTLKKLKENKSFQKLKALLLSMDGKKLTTETAADFFGYNKDYFGKVFKSETGMTFTVFYKTLKIEYAGLLLSTGKYKVYEICDIVGFSSVDYFTRIFKQITGKTPSECK